MIISEGMRQDAGARAVTFHPLDPLTAEEIVEASRILRSERDLGPRVRFETIVLKEPSKEESGSVSRRGRAWLRGERSWRCWTIARRRLTRLSSRWMRGGLSTGSGSMGFSRGLCSTSFWSARRR